MEFFRQLADGVRETWNRLAMRARINIGVAAVAVLALIVALVVFNARPEYVLLYDGLSREDSISIRQFLDEETVPYVVKRDGGLIEVPFRERGRVMQALADRELPKRYGRLPGFERFNETDLMTNRYLLDVRYMQAVTEQLQNTLNAHDYITRSVVTINEADESLFTDMQKPSEAAVVIEVTRRPTDREIKSLLHHIGAAGGAELDERNITLTTTEGDVLWLPRQDEFTALAGTLQEHKDSEERRLESKIRSHFERAGIRAVVTVAAEIDAKNMSETKSVATDGAVVSEEKLNTEISSSESLPEGPVGASANPPQGSQSQGGVETTETTTQSTTNFEPSITHTTTEQKPGTFTGFSVAALISGGTTPTIGDDGEATGEVEYEPLSDEKKVEYQTLIASMLGPSVEPDSVYVSDLPLDEALGQPQSAGFFSAAGATEFGARYSGVIGNVFLTLCVILGFIIIRRILLSQIIIPEEVVEEDGEDEEEEIQRDLTKEMIERLDQAALEDPELFAAMLRTWMTGAGKE